MASIQADVNAFIQLHGFDFTVHRVGRATDITVRFTIAPLQYDRSAQLRVEGIDNVAEEMSHIFTCPAGSDVRSNDSITFNGYMYKFLTCTPTFDQGVSTGIMCVGVRVKTA